MRNSSQINSSRRICHETGLVFGFTIKQMIKSKSNLITFGIMALILAVIIPVGGFFFGDAASAGDPVTYYTSILSVEDYLEEDQVGYSTRFNVQYAYSIIAMMICVFSVTYIVHAIVEEKASKLVELLMVSVSPMALVMGKILAVMAFMFGMVFVLCGVATLSWAISGLFMDVSFVGRILASFGITADLLRLEPLTIVVLIVCLLLAYLMFSLIAGLAGAGCSNMEEVEGANTAAMMAILGGFLISCFTQGFGDSLAVVLSVCPVVSAFSAPIYYIFGDIGMGVMAASWAVQILVIAGLLVLSSRVYDQLIMYRGSRMTMGRILSLARGKKRGEKGGKQA